MAKNVLFAMEVTGASSFTRGLMCSWRSRLEDHD
jgi:hypothetical protein